MEGAPPPRRVQGRGVPRRSGLPTALRCTIWSTAARRSLVLRPMPRALTRLRHSSPRSIRRPPSAATLASAGAVVCIDGLRVPQALVSHPRKHDQRKRRDHDRVPASDLLLHDMGLIGHGFEQARRPAANSEPHRSGAFRIGSISCTMDAPRPSLTRFAHTAGRPAQPPRSKR